MAGKDYKITRSNYTIRKFHEQVSGGTVYERDFMATTNLGGFSSGEIPNSESNFKMVDRIEDSSARKREYGKWIKSPDGGYEWKMGDIKNDGYTSEGEIRKRPNYDSLLDFAYYGSCVELVKTSITNIINHFPAFIVFTGKVFASMDKKFPQSGFGYVVENKFGIDLFSTKGWNGKLDDEPSRHFYDYQKYYRLYTDGNPCTTGDTDDDCCITNITITESSNPERFCYGNYDYSIKIKFKNLSGEIEIRRYNLHDGETILLTDKNYYPYMIGPSMSFIDEYFNNITDFESLLLNRNTTPKYTANIDFYEENEHGIEYAKKRITFPSTNDGLILDISSDEYENYVVDLLNLAEFLDEHKTNNIIRMMTHDSVRNMDNAYFRNDDDPDDRENYDEGESKFKQYLYIIGRFFDDIKRNIDVVRDSKNISYDENNNLPDYFISDELNNKGWEIYSSINGMLLGEKIKPFSGTDSLCVDAEYDEDRVNVEFMRNLLSNSSSILSRKGTRSGIESILGMFGMHSYDFDNENYDYKIKEHSLVVSHKGYTGPVDSESVLPLTEYNMMKSDYPTDEGYDDEYSENGLPVRISYAYKSDGEIVKYAVPWFSYHDSLDGNPYFQMYGGWGKRNEKIINEDGMVITDSGYTKEFIYDETISYIRIVNFVNDLRNVTPDNLKGDDICYVSEDTPDFYEKWPSRYFILHDSDYSAFIEGDEGFEKGWECVSMSGNTEDSDMVRYVDSIIDDYRGNNPHVGYGKYDEGSRYKRIYEQLLWDSIDRDSFNDEAYDCESGEIISGITECGFNVEYKEDNCKSWYFGPVSNVGMVIISGGTDDELFFGSDASGSTFFSVDSEYKCVDLSVDESGTTESGITVASADSIINVKNIEIVFMLKDGLDEDEYKKYINNSVMPYLYQVIPSTSVLKISFEN